MFLEHRRHGLLLGVKEHPTETRGVAERGPSSWALTSIAHWACDLGQITVPPRSLSSETKLFSVQGPERIREGYKVASFS